MNLLVSFPLASHTKAESLIARTGVNQMTDTDRQVMLISSTVLCKVADSSVVNMRPFVDDRGLGTRSKRKLNVVSAK